LTVEANRLEKASGISSQRQFCAKHYETVGFANCWDLKPDQSPSAKDGREAAVRKLGPEIGAVPIVYSIAAFERVAAASAASRRFAPREGGRE
jgi:hypothetical protein